MDAKVDYLSWTVMQSPTIDQQGRVSLPSVLDILEQHAPHFFGWAEQHPGWQAGSGRGHYAESLLHPLLFAAIRFGGLATHVLIEMPGTACADARDSGQLADILLDAAARCTRLDVAVDIPGDVSPSEFVQAGYNERFKAKASLVSDSGVTEYVGSMKSDRFARVYKYAPPHPRAGTMRVEHVFRKEYARTAVGMLAQSSILELAAACGNTWGWRHPAWSPALLTDGKVKSSRADKHEPGRLRWLYGVCLPAIAKAHREGLLDAHEYVQELLNAL